LYYLRIIVFGKIIAVIICTITVIAWVIERETLVKHVTKQKYLEQSQKGKRPVPFYSLKVAVNCPIFCIPKIITKLELRLEKDYSASLHIHINTNLVQE